MCVISKYNLLQWMFFIPLDNWKALIFAQFVFTRRFFATTMYLNSLKQVFWKKCLFHACYYLHNNIKMLRKTKRLTLLCFFLLLFFPHFSFSNALRKHCFLLKRFPFWVNMKWDKLLFKDYVWNHIINFIKWEKKS